MTFFLFFFRPKSPEVTPPKKRREEEQEESGDDGEEESSDDEGKKKKKLPPVPDPKQAKRMATPGTSRTRRQRTPEDETAVKAMVDEVVESITSDSEATPSKKATPSKPATQSDEPTPSTSKGTSGGKKVRPRQQRSEREVSLALVIIQLSLVNQIPKSCFFKIRLFVTSKDYLVMLVLTVISNVIIRFHWITKYPKAASFF
jgi:hypothetical protein